MELPIRIAFKLRNDHFVSIACVNKILRENRIGKLIFSVWIYTPDGKNTLHKIAKYLNITKNFEPNIYNIINGGPDRGSWINPILAFEWFKFLPKELKIQATDDLKTFLIDKNQPIQLYSNQRENNISDISHDEINIKAKVNKELENKQIKENFDKEESDIEIDKESNIELNPTFNEKLAYQENVELTIIEKQELEDKFKELFKLEQVNPNGFIIPFEFAWKTLGYSRSDKAKQGLERSDLKKDIDYQIPQLGDLHTGGKPRFNANLTSRGFKRWGLSAPTEKGKLIRDYFIEVETKWQILKQNLNSGYISMIDNQSGESYQEWKEKAEQAQIQIKELQDKNQLLLKQSEDKEIQTKYDLFLAKQLTIIEEKNKLINPIITQFYDQTLIYLAYIGTHQIKENNNKNTILIEYGKTDSIKRRKYEQEREFGIFDIIELFRVPIASTVETSFGNKVDYLGFKTQFKAKSKSIHREVVFLHENHDLYDIIDIMNEQIKIANTINIEIKNITLEYESKLKDKDLELSKKDLEIERKIGELKDTKLEILQREIKIKELQNELRIYKPIRKPIVKPKV